MSRTDPVINGIAHHRLPTHYPRTVGRNARLGSHGSGGESAVVVLTTDDGRQGWGMTEQTVPAGLDDTLIGRPLSEVIDPAAGIRDERHHAYDVALHDLAGVVADQPVHALLGSRGTTEVEVYDGAIYFDDLDPDESPRGLEVVLQNVRDDAALGHTGFKLKIGRGNRWLDRAAGDARDIEVTRAVREAYPDAKLLVDANDGYDLAGFSAYLEAVADVGLYWVEEPFLDDADDLAALRTLLDRISPATRIAEGETSPDVEALLPIVERGDIDVLLMDVISYGITRWRALMPRLGGSVLASPHAWGRPLKTLYAGHLAAGLDRIEIVEGVPGHTDGVDTSAYGFADGVLSLPDRPGFGLPVPTL